MNAAPCIQFGAANLTLKLNRFTITGQNDPSAGCQGTHVEDATVTLNEDGIASINQTDEAIQGPGLVQRFRGASLFLLNSSRSRVARVRASTNCLSGLLVSGSSDNLIESNVSVRNGTVELPCGGV